MLPDWYRPIRIFCGSGKAGGMLTGWYNAIHHPLKGNPAMKIAQNTVVTLHYTLSDAQGNLIEESREPMVYLHGGYQNTLPKIEEALEGQEAGYKTTIQVEPEDAFGEYDPDLVRMEDRNRLPTPLEVGMQFEGSPEEGDERQESLIFTVTEIADDKVVLDGNHPLAGIALRFGLDVVNVRAASDEEVAHGHVHGEHGHHHGHDDDEGDAGDEFRSLPLQ
jgi:FKBP-type peptidyl-prolyl cis-trans isomerase SlyD